MLSGERVIRAGQLTLPHGVTNINSVSSAVGCHGDITTHDLTSALTNTRMATPTELGSFIAGVSSHYFATADQVGVVSLNDVIYGTCQSSITTGLHNISLVSMATASLTCIYSNLVVCVCVCAGVLCVWSCGGVWR